MLLRKDASYPSGLEQRCYKSKVKWTNSTNAGFRELIPTRTLRVLLTAAIYAAERSKSVFVEPKEYRKQLVKH